MIAHSCNIALTFARGRHRSRLRRQFTSAGTNSPRTPFIVFIQTHLNWNRERRTFYYYQAASQHNALLLDAVFCCRCSTICLSLCWKHRWALQNGWNDRDAVWRSRLAITCNPCVATMRHVKSLWPLVIDSVCIACSRVYVTVRRLSVRLSIRLSVLFIDRCSSVRRVCRCGPDRQEMSIDSGCRRTPSSTANSSKCEQCHVSWRSKLKPTCYYWLMLSERTLHSTSTVV